MDSSKLQTGTNGATSENCNVFNGSIK